MSAVASHEKTPTAEVTLATIDLGGTKIAAGLVHVTDGGPALITRRELPTGPNPTAIVNTVSKLVTLLIADAADHQIPAPSAVGIGAAGVIDPSTGDVVDATDSIPGWKGTKLGELVARASGLPTFVNNDVHAHALGEAWQGAGAGLTDFALVAVGTGVGITLVLDGSIRDGQHRLAGNGAAIEPISAGPAVAAEYNRRQGTTLTLKEIAAHLDTDAVAREVIADSATHLGTCLGHLVNTLDPEALIIGGGVPQIGAAWRDPMIAALRSTAHPALRDIPLLDAQLSTDAALIGAAKLALDGLAAHTHTPRG